MVVGFELARDEPRLGFRDVGVVRVVEQDDAPGVLADAVPGPGAAEVARGRLRRVAEVRVVRADQDERLDALALAEPHGRRGPAAVAHDDGLLVDAEPAQEGHPLMFARDDRVGHHLWQDDLVEEAGVVQSALEPAVPVLEFAIQRAAPGDDDAADHDGWVFEATAIWPHKKLPGPMLRASEGGDEGKFTAALQNLKTSSSSAWLVAALPRARSRARLSARWTRRRVNHGG